MSKPILLDLFCGQGGAAMGYHLAGFDVVGFDINPQPLYPFTSIQTDVLVAKFKYMGASVIHASPPCQAYSTLKTMTNGEHPDLVARTRELLVNSGLPYVIENVVGAPLTDPIMLCGSMFGLEVVAPDGVNRQLRRHRLFESNMPLTAPACNHRKNVIGVYGTGGGGQMTRGYKADKVTALEVMGTPWMDRRGVSQAIPPAYTEHIGLQLMEALNEQAA